MPEPVGTTDAALLRLEQSSAPQHVGTVLVLEPPPGGVIDLDDLAGHVAGRIAYVPRYRQRVRPVAAGLLDAVWVDDARFDLTFHIRRTALPRPGGAEQLRELVGRVCARPLDRSHPLWEVYLVDGLAQGAVALVTKTHQVLVDGVHGLDLAHVLLDDAPAAAAAPPAAWHPAAEPGSAELLLSGALRAVAHPRVALGRGAGTAVGTTVDAATAVAGRLITRTSAGRRPAAAAGRGPLEARLSPHRRFAAARVPLADHRLVAKRLAGAGPAPTVHDVIMAGITGALRAWFLQRGRPAEIAVLRAVVPVSVHRAGGARLVEGQVLDLPVGEPNPLLRLHHIAFGAAQAASARPGGTVPALDLADRAGFAPATLHSVGARVATLIARQSADLVVTDVPGPRAARYLAGARLHESYPVMPLRPGHALAIGVTSYDGTAFHGFSGDREAVPDLDALADLVPEAVAELVQATA